MARASPWRAGSTRGSFGLRRGSRSSSPSIATVPVSPQANLRAGHLQGALPDDERVFAWEDKFRRLLLRFERISGLHYAFKTLAYTMINLWHYCQT
jgi:hypothetical protein